MQILPKVTAVSNRCKICNQIPSKETARYCEKCRLLTLAEGFLITKEKDLTVYKTINHKENK